MSVLADAPGECCIKTLQHSGTPLGTIETIAGVETYISPPQTLGHHKKILLFFADVFGPLYINSKLLQDYFASYDYLVLGLDYFEGDPVHVHTGEADFNVREWIQPKKIRADQLVPEWIDAVKETFGTYDTKYTAVGYCFGAPYVMDLVATDWLAAGAFAHPAFLSEDHFRKAKQPIFISCAEIDHTFSLEARRKAEDILVRIKTPYHIQVFGSTEHGFAVRANNKDRLSRWAKEQSADAILRWFNEFSAFENSE
ncbi:alpha/beta-hydrolase [Obba rivulosa]|uniref:Alpha/beta-hydrolase n=1 Tax=Obba rivulosa TaxID=1052685 RepID=A0A8E2AMN1_9APHY|nr:alpha/beta-hydrolase [Obba rivulosa]